LLLWAWFRGRAMPGLGRYLGREIMFGGEAEAAQIPVRCSSSGGSRRREPGCGRAWRLVGMWREATAATYRLGAPLRVPAAIGGEARLGSGGAAWTSR
jgi:hypothetical protein